jgi:hypothetical protein
MKKILGYITSLLVLSSCSKTFLDVNSSPNAATYSRSDYQFTGALATTASSMTGPSQTGGAWTGYYGFSTSFTGGGVQKTQIFTNTDFNYWDGPYHNIVDYQYVIANGAKEGYGYLVGPSKIMQAYLFQRLVDMYGNVPYTQAMNLQSYVTPAYDDAQTIYKALISKIDSAITDIKAASFPSSAPEDIMFTGNKTKWIQLANSLKLRILVRQAYIAANTAYINTELNKIVSEGTGFLTSSAFINPGYLKQTGKVNPFYSNWGFNENDVEQTNHRFIKIGDLIVNYLKSTNDIFRLQRVADPKVSNPALDATGQPDKSNPNNYVGIPLGGRGNAYLETLVSSIGSSQIVKGDAVRPYVFMTAAEVNFLLSEAAFRYGIAGLGDPQVNYQNGITQSFILYSATQTATSTATAAAATAAAATYYAQPINNVNWVASTDKIAAIITQKWVALCNFDGFEAWTEWRRTKIPNVPLSVQTGASTVQPRRFYYPISESNTNSANLNLQGAYSVYTSKIFWDK